jgi:hypothetical protein
MGTAAYIAPEQVTGSPPAPPSDVYALGLVLLEALTGERPYPHAVGIAAAIARVNAPPEIPDTVDAEWGHLLGRMLQTDPALRPTALEVAAAAKRLCMLARAEAVTGQHDVESTLALLFPDAVGVDESILREEDPPTRPIPLIGAGAHVARATPTARRRRAALAGGLAAAAMAVVAVFGVGAAMTTADPGDADSDVSSIVQQDPPAIVAEVPAEEPVVAPVDAPTDDAGTNAVDPASDPAAPAPQPAVEEPQPAVVDQPSTQDQRKAEQEQHKQEARDRGAQGNGQGKKGPGG